MRVFSTLQMVSAFVVWAVTLIAAASADDWAKAVVKIGGCSGVCVSDAGLILTAKHCTLKDRERVAFEDGPTVWATKLVTSRNGDGPVAFVCDGDDFPHRPVAKTKPKPGDRVIFTTAFAQSSALAAVISVTAQTTNAEAICSVENALIQFVLSLRK